MPIFVWCSDSQQLLQVVDLLGDGATAQVLDGLADTGGTSWGVSTGGSCSWVMPH